MSGLYCCLCVTEPDGKAYLRERLMIPMSAGLAAALALVGGAKDATLLPDSPADALLEGQMTGNVELMGAAYRILGAERADSLLATGGEAYARRLAASIGGSDATP